MHKAQDTAGQELPCSTVAAWRSDGQSNSRPLSNTGSLSANLPGHPFLRDNVLRQIAIPAPSTVGDADASATLSVLRSPQPDLRTSHSTSKLAMTTRNQRPVLAVLGAAHLQRDMILRAQALGCVVHAFSWPEGATAATDADHFHPISTTATESIVEACRQIGIDGIVTTSSDVAVPTIAAVAQALGLPGPSVASASICTRKDLMRERLKSAGLACPAFVAMDSLPEEPPLDLPFVVKPVDRSGAAGVRIVREGDPWRQYIKDALDASLSGHAICESLVAGRQFSVETWSYDRDHNVVAITEEFFGPGETVELGDLVPARVTEEEFDALASTTLTALDALEVTNGMGHSEVRLDRSGQVTVIEVANRLGGDFRNRLVSQSMGIDLDAIAIKLALGMPVDADTMRTVEAPAPCAIFWMMDEEDAVALRAINSREKATHFCEFSHGGAAIRSRAKSSSERLGYAIMTDRNEIQAELSRRGLLKR